MIPQAVVAADTTLRAAIFSRIDAIGAKLGVAASQVWPVLVRQARAEAYGDLVIAVVLVVALLVLIKGARYCFDGDRDMEMGGVFAVMASIICLIIITAVSVDAVQRFANPEYYALHYLVTAVTGGK